MRWAAIVLTGCSFSASSAPAIDGAVDGAPDVPDAPDAVPAVPFCDPTDPLLIACYEFENTTADASANHLDATNTNVGYDTGKVGKAMVFAANSAADVADSTKFDVVALTIEAWIHPSAIPAAGLRAGIVDMNGQYGLFVHETGRVQCTMVNGISIQIDAGITTTAWAHVACTYDGSTTKIYIDGAKIAEGSGGNTLATGGNTGISIGADNPPGSGSRLLGMIDQLRMTARALTPAEICKSALCP